MSGVAHYAGRVPAFAQQLMSAFWPGPLTLILPRRDGVAAAAAGGQNSIGLRCPAHPVAQALLAALRKPADGAREVWGIAAPSANRFGRVSPTTAQHVQSELGDAVSGGLLILDGGPCEVGIESTIVDCTRGAPVLLRPGGISRAQIEAACGRPLLSADDVSDTGQPAPKASGTLESHYAPQARVRLMDARALQKALDMLGKDMDATPSSGPSIAVYARAKLSTASRQILLRQMPGDAAVAAHELFSVLRELDDKKVKLIWVETPPDTAQWDGVRDRLERASA
jgi:L-threonylcarbamoyladenylate synthase